MRILLAALAIAVTTAAVHAQDAGGHKGRGSHQKTDQTQKSDQQKKAVDDAYKSAVKGMPDKDKPDPWKNAR